MPSSYLERHGRGWRVVVSVPRQLQHEFGTKLKESLPTESLTEANQLKWPVVARLKATFHSQQQVGPSEQEIITEALTWRAQQASGLPIQDDDTFYDRADDIRGAPTRSDSPPDEPVYDGERTRLASLFVGVARGRVTPLNTLVAEWHQQATRKERTKREDRRALELLSRWCVAGSVTPNVEAIERRVAGRFIGDLIRPLPFNEERPIAAKTANKYVSSLSAYWRWMERRGHLSENVWARQSLPVAATPAEQEERPLTDGEVRTLLSGDPSHATLPHLMRIAALTGARIEAIVQLKVRDTKHDMFVFKPQKRERGNRSVPIHSSLASVVASRADGKTDNDDLFPELAVPAIGSGRERSMPASKAFTRYRRIMNVDDVVVGRRRSRVNFHSFRRWFATKAEQAGQPEHIIAAVLGHRRPGMTFGRYSGGPSVEQLRACVEAVCLPA